MAADESSWRTPNFRQSVVAKIEEAIRSSGMPTTKNSMEMENHVFQKAKTKEEYLGFVARLILHVREMNSKKNPGMGGPAGGGGQNMQDPINALQTLARQGSGNQLMGLVPSQGGAQVTATNLLQTLNQRPGNQQRMQSPVQEKVDNAKKTGSGGGENSKTTEVDEFITQIIGNNNPIIEGLGVSDSMDENESTLTPQHHADAEEEAIPTLTEKKPFEMKKRSRGLNTNASKEIGDSLAELKKKKIELVIENMEKESYLKTLQILKLERELQLPPSQFTTHCNGDENTVCLISKEAEQH